MKPQRQVVLEILEERGDKGAHSFEFIQARIPRVAARVCELRADGYRIDSEPEALHGAAKGVRYKLTNVGSSTEGHGEADASAEGSSPSLGVASGVADAELPPRPGSASPPTNPYTYELWEDAA
jgi:hypothetical protein